MPRNTFGNDSGDITREQLDELKTKFQLLEGDRKAYFETYETTKRTNEQLFRELRAKNRELRQALANLQREHGSGGGVGQDDEITRVSTELNAKRTAYDQLKHRVKKFTEELELKRDQFKELELEAAKVNDDDSPLTRKVRLRALCARVGRSLRRRSPRARPLLCCRSGCLRTGWTRL